MRKTSYIYIFLILICGFFLSFKTYSKINVYEQSKNHEALSAQAHRIAKDFEDFLRDKYNTLRYMKAYFYAYESLGLQEFELFSTSILLFEPDIDSLMFVLELAPESLGDYAKLYKREYGRDLDQNLLNENSSKLYPAHFLKSFKQEDISPGGDVAADKKVLETIKRVYDDAEPKMVLLNQEEETQYNVYIIDPLFTVDSDTKQVKNRINFNNYFASHGFIFLGLDIFKFSDPRNQTLQGALCLDIGYEHEKAHKSLIRTDQCQLEEGGETFDIFFDLFGVNWYLKFSPQNQSYVEYIWQKYFVLYGGIIFTIVLASYFYLIVWQRTQDELSQRKLNEEIAKKEQLNLQMQDYTDKLELARLQQMDIYRSLQEEKIKAEQANKTKSDFLANMSHELRTPLNSILGIAKMVKDDTSNSTETAEMMDIMEASSTALLEIVNDILDLSKIEAGKVQLEFIDFDVREVVKNVTGSLKTIADRKGLYLNCQIKQDDFPVLKGDPLRLNRIFMNLIGNAVKYSVEGGVTIIVDYDQLGSDQIVLKCSISDTGIGISKEKMTHIFEKFTQADETTTRTFGGTGLGLTITQDLLEMMGGDIHVESVEGLGSTFSFELPLKISDTKILESHEAADAAKDSKDKEVDKGRIEASSILVVEDNEFNVILIKKFLKKIGFKHIVYAHDGAEAVEAFDKEPFDVILMDCHMPVKSGYEATEEIRRAEEVQGAEFAVPIIALTADAMVGVKEKCLAAGMSDYLSKPVDYNDLLGVMKRWLRDKERRKSA